MISLKWDISDPITLNFLFLLSVMFIGFFHMYMERRQYLFCEEHKEPPAEVKAGLPDASYEKARLMESHRSELELWKHCVYTVCCICELTFSLYPHLWTLANNYGMTLGDTENYTPVTNVVFIFFFSVYLSIRYFPVVLYNHYILQPLYNIPEEDMAPMVGLICATLFVIMVIQIMLIPLTLSVLFIEEACGEYFYLVHWAILFGMSIILILLLRLFMLILHRKFSLPDHGPLRSGMDKLAEDTKFSIKRIQIMENCLLRQDNVLNYGCCCCGSVIICVDVPLHKDPQESGKSLSAPQVVAYVAKALGDWYYSHFVLVFVVFHFFLLNWFLLFNLLFKFKPIFEAFGFKKDTVPNVASYVLIYKYVFPAYIIVANFFMRLLIRTNSYRSDGYAARMGYSVELQNGLLKHCKDNGYFPDSDFLYVLFYWRASYLCRRLRRLKLRQERNKDGAQS